MNKSTIFLLVLSLVSLIVFIQSAEGRKQFRDEEVTPADAEKAVAVVKEAYEMAFLKKGNDLERLMVPMDEEGAEDIWRTMEKIRLPDFGKARVSSPSFNPDICYVSFPEGRACVCQFTLRKKGGVLLLEGACRKSL